MIERYHLAWWRTLKFAIARLRGYRSYGGIAESPRRPVSEDQFKVVTFIERIQNFCAWCMRPFYHVRNSILRSWRRARDEWEDCRLWWRNPIQRSNEPSRRSGWQPLQGVDLRRATTTPVSLADFATSYKHSGTEEFLLPKLSKTQVSTTQIYYDEPVPGHTIPRGTL